MKSHSNSSPWAATFCWRSCARFSPTRRTPASASARQLLGGDVLGRREHLAPRGRGPPLRASARGDLRAHAARGSRGPARRRRPVISSTMRPPPGARRARLRGCGRRSARRRSCRRRRRGPRRRRRRAAARRRSRAGRGGGRRAWAPRERVVHLGADLVAADARAGPTTAAIGCPSAPSSRSARTPSSSTPAARPRQPAWSIATAPSQPSATGRQSAASTIAPTPRRRRGVAVGVDRHGRRPPRAGDLDRRRATAVPCTWQLAHSQRSRALRTAARAVRGRARGPRRRASRGCPRRAS